MEEASWEVAQTELQDKLIYLSATLKTRTQEMESLKKSLRKAEFERNAAQRYVDSLKSEVAALNTKLHEERKKNKTDHAGQEGRSDIEEGIIIIIIIIILILIILIAFIYTR